MCSLLFDWILCKRCHDTELISTESDGMLKISEKNMRGYAFA